MGAFSSPVSISLDNLPSAYRPLRRHSRCSLETHSSVTFTTGSGYSSGGALSVDATSGTLAHSTQVAVSPGSFTGDLAVSGNTFSGLGLAPVTTPGTYYPTSNTSAFQTSTVSAVVGYVPYQVQPTLSPTVAPLNILLLSGTSSLPYPPDQPGTLLLSVNFDGGEQVAVLPYDQIVPDFSLNFSPASLTIAAGSSANLAIGFTPISVTGVSYCGEPYNSTAFSAVVMAPAPPVGASTSQPTVNLCNPQPAVISVPATVPPGNYELTVQGQLTTIDEPYINYASFLNPEARISATHLFGVPITVTAAPAPSFQIGASPTDISVAAGESFSVTVSATGSNGFTGSIVIGK